MLLALLLAGFAHAGKMFPLSIEQLTQKAQLVLHGNVLNKSVQRDPQGRIYTKMELQAAETWKGDSKGNRFTLVQSGGVLGEEIARTDDQAEFAIGEEVVLFLRVNERGEGVVIGLVQGKFEVTTDRTGQKTVHSIFHGRPPGDDKSAGDKTKHLTLGELKQRVQGGRP